MNLLANQVAVVTGAGRGIGRAIALKLASEAAGVACISKTAENSSKVAEEIRVNGGKAWAYAVDVSNASEVTAVCEKILSEAGRIDILVNNAGITRDTLLMRMSEEDWDQVMDTNLKGAFLFCQALVRHFVKQRSGRVINISSTSGLLGNAGQCNYAASKAGLIGLTKSMARELASRTITVNAIAPGFIDTDMTSGLKSEIKEAVLKQVPMNAFGQPEDIADAALFLASPAARYITGQVLSVDGGLAM